LALSPRDIAEIERAHASGLSSKQILELLESHGEHLTEATLRKYVQLGLLPRSRRVGEKGKHRGSRGIYPVEVIRRIDEIRRAMNGGDTLETLARATQAVRARLAAARVSVGEVLDAAETDLGARNFERTNRKPLESELSRLGKQAQAWLKAMEKWTLALQQAERRANGTAKKRPGGR
jgi:DNA-binding transcriptional MerR regulator